jgi:hypothetical protein
MSKQLSIEEQIKVIQSILFDNDDYPNRVVKDDKAPYIPLKQE